jgi:uncharacterized protein (TIGR00299 family) protein
VIAYIDCIGGLAGDMLNAALLSAGAPESVLNKVPACLGLSGVELRIDRVERHGIEALHLEVRGSHEQPDRRWRSIRTQLEEAELDERVRQRALSVFARLAEVEGKVHGVPTEEVHFHELGAVDTLVEIVGAVALLEELHVERVVCSTLPLSRGFVTAAHGLLPLPAPATAALLVGAPIVGTDIDTELVTPTGAALASTLAESFGELPPMTLERIGYGAGTADLRERPNLVRVLLGRGADPEPGERAIRLLETNLDDLVPELVPDAVERCVAAGALDVWTVQAGMKKGRPGIVLSALARPEAELAVARAILEETTALGVRVTRLDRYELERHVRSVEVSGGSVRVKVGRLDGRVVNVAPEHDDCAALARVTGMSVKSVWVAALAAARELDETDG